MSCLCCEWVRHLRLLLYMTVNEITWIQFTSKQKPKRWERYWVHESLPSLTKQRLKISSKKDLLIISACNLYYYQKNRVAWSSNTMNKFSKFHAKSSLFFVPYLVLPVLCSTFMHMHLNQKSSSSFILLILIYSNWLWVVGLCPLLFSINLGNLKKEKEKEDVS